MPLSISTGTAETEAVPYPLQLRLDLPRKNRGRNEPESGRETDAENDEVLTCARCSAPITLQRFSIPVNGRHEHAFFNPAGIAFEIRCFRRAPGGMIQGEATSRFTWFAGYTWQYCLCRSCSTHLGWFFNSATDSFFGLICNRIV